MRVFLNSDRPLTSLQLDHDVDLLLRIPETHSLLAATATAITVISPSLKTCTIPIARPAKNASLVRIFFLPRVPHTEISVYGLVFDNGEVVFAGVKGADEDTCSGEDARRGKKSLSEKTLAKGEKVVDAFMDDKSMVLHLLSEQSGNAGFS